MRSSNEKLFTSQHKAFHVSKLKANVCLFAFLINLLIPMPAQRTKERIECYLQVVHNLGL
jgi:hypothetical protein